MKTKAGGKMKMEGMVSKKARNAKMEGKLLPRSQRQQTLDFYTCSSRSGKEWWE